ncbi:LysE/ArgO family amino acid transporter [Salinibacterium hongtaonis]|uniref:LysE/ArgO family amino acid transporter n=1 Tax=Homoserinimonas hongtaonis TaxID=2079791 RepID=UPI001F5456BA|nr:LysE/ArgO family amino acid transporter [Salinibacterium hongtaonis]
MILPLDLSLPTIAAGFGVGFGLIVAIGAQNAFILRSGVRRQHLLAVVLVCAISDVVLITSGIAGIGALLDSVPWVISLIRWGGVAFLTAYGLMAAWRAWRPRARGLTVEDTHDDATERESAPVVALAPAHAAMGASTSPRGTTSESGTTMVQAPPRPAAARRGMRTRSTLVTAVLTALAFTWLNPHTYLDAVVLLGSIANTHGDSGRWMFGLGAITASFVWFTLIGFGSRLLAHRLASPTAWRILDGIIAVIMLSIALSLALSS